MFFRFGAVVSWASICWCILASGAAGELLSEPVGFELGQYDYYVHPGTKISSPSASGPPGYVIYTSDAVHYLAASVRIDGGEFSGGDATYNGPIDSYADVLSGAGARMTSATADIFGGHFRGGTAYSTSRSGYARSSDGLTVTSSEVRIYGGVFEGGRLITPNTPYSPSNSPQSFDFSASWSTVHLYGGKLSNIIINQSLLHVYARNLVRNYNSVMGEFIDGTRLWISVFGQTSGAIVLHNVPEPSAACSAVAALSALAMRNRKRVQRRRRPGRTGASWAPKTERR